MTRKLGADTLEGVRLRLNSENGRLASRLALALLALALAVLLWRAVRPAGSRAPASAGGPGGESGALSAADSAGSDQDIEHALRMARAATPLEVDSTAIKSAWHDDVAGVELGSLTPAQHDVFLRFANAERCTCGCGYTLAGCLASDMTCDVSRASVAALLDSVSQGRIRSARGVRQRPRNE